MYMYTLYSVVNCIENLVDVLYVSVTVMKRAPTNLEILKARIVVSSILQWLISYVLAIKCLFCSPHHNIRI